MLAEQAYTLCVCEGEGDAKAPLLSTLLEPASKSSPKLEGWAEQPRGRNGAHF